MLRSGHFLAKSMMQGPSERLEQLSLQSCNASSVPRTLLRFQVGCLGEAVVVFPPDKMVRSQRRRRVQMPPDGADDMAFRMLRGFLGLQAKAGGKPRARKERTKGRAKRACKADRVVPLDESSNDSSSSTSSSDESASSNSDGSMDSVTRDVVLRDHGAFDGSRLPAGGPRSSGGGVGTGDADPGLPPPGSMPGSGGDPAPGSMPGSVGAAPPVPDRAFLTDVPDPAPRRPRAAPDFHSVREKREFSWGPWKIAPIHSRGVHSGWGAVCGAHRDIDDGPRVQCKIQLQFGKTLGDDEARLRVKLWLYHGLDVEEAMPNDRHEHLSLKPRTLALTHTEDELDRIVLAAATS